MLDFERKLSLLDLAVIIILIAIACIIGKIVMIHFQNAFSFNAITIGTLIIGELCWHMSRKSLIKKWEKNEDKA